MSNLVIDLGRGLIIAGVLFLFLMAVLVAGWLMSLREDWLRRDAENAAAERGMGQAEARKIEKEARAQIQTNLVPRKVIDVIILD